MVIGTVGRSVEIDIDSVEIDIDHSVQMITG